jgi:hypothetical protein
MVAANLGLLTASLGGWGNTHWLIGPPFHLRTDS